MLTSMLLSIVVKWAVQCLIPPQVEPSKEASAAKDEGQTPQEVSNNPPELASWDDTAEDGSRWNYYTKMDSLFGSLELEFLGEYVNGSSADEQGPLGTRADQNGNGFLMKATLVRSFKRKIEDVEDVCLKAEEITVPAAVGDFNSRHQCVVVSLKSDGAVSDVSRPVVTPSLEARNPRRYSEVQYTAGKRLRLIL